MPVCRACAARRLPLPTHVRAPLAHGLLPWLPARASAWYGSALCNAEEKVLSHRWNYTVAKTKQVLHFNGTCANPGKHPTLLFT